MSYGLMEIQTALFALLDGDATLNALISGVYDRVKDRTAYPYVVIGDARVKDWSSHDKAGNETQMRLHVFSRKGGRKEALEIASRLYELLHSGALSVSGHALILMRHNASDVVLEADGRTYHVTLEFTLLSHEN